MPQGDTMSKFIITPRIKTFLLTKSYSAQWKEGIDF